MDGGANGVACSPVASTLITLAHGLLDRATLLDDDPEQVTAIVRLFLQSYGGTEVLHPGELPPQKAITPMDLSWQDHPPCFLGVGDIDFLHDSSSLYARELQERGIDMAHKIYPGAPHGFLNFNHAQRPALRQDVLDFLESL